MNPQIEVIYSSRKVTAKSGAQIALHSEIDPADGAFIHQVISQDSSISKTLEVGCAHGLASLHICDALSSRSNPHHVIIDPFQYSEWEGAGIRNLEDAGIDFFRLIEKKSEFALPELLSQGESRFDLIFIDGWHTFDHTLLDCFYATRLLKTGGYLLIDDADMPGVARATDYFSRYPCYQIHSAMGEPQRPTIKKRVEKAVLGLLSSSARTRIFHPTFLRNLYEPKPRRVLALRKIAEDKRSWTWFPVGF